MSFRRNSSESRRWQDWLHLHRERLLAAGVPDWVLTDESRWLRFLEHGYDHETGWSTRLLDEVQARALQAFLLQEYGDQQQKGVLRDLAVRFMNSWDDALAATRAIVVLDVPWSGYPRHTLELMWQARDKLATLGITCARADEESHVVREWLNEFGPPFLRGDVARGAGTILWLEHGKLVDVLAAGMQSTLQEILQRTQERWGVP